jgi:hypothetical protein
VTILGYEPKALPEVPQALIEEAKRHRRRRRLATAGVVLLVAAVFLGMVAFVSWDVGGGRPTGAGRMTPSPLVGLPAYNDAYETCPGSAEVGPETSPDGLPARASATTNLASVISNAKSMERGPNLGFPQRFPGLPESAAVRAIRVGRGGGYVWTRNSSGQVEVVHVKNYGIYVFLRAASQCPFGGWARLSDGGVQVTFLAPKP